MHPLKTKSCSFGLIFSRWQMLILRSEIVSSDCDFMMNFSPLRKIHTSILRGRVGCWATSSTCRIELLLTAACERDLVKSVKGVPLWTRQQASGSSICLQLRARTSQSRVWLLCSCSEHPFPLLSLTKTVILESDWLTAIPFSYYNLYSLPSITQSRFCQYPSDEQERSNRMACLSALQSRVWATMHAGKQIYKERIRVLFY